MLKKFMHPHLHPRSWINLQSLQPSSVKRIRFVILLLIASIHLQLKAQQNDLLLWMNYSVTVPANEKLAWGGDFGVRGLGSTLELSQLLVRPAVAYKIKENSSIGGAVAWFGTFNQGTLNINELRFHQELNAEWPRWEPLHFFYRLRVEERFFFYKFDIPNAFRVRLRALMGVQTKDLTWFGPKRPLYFQSILEGFKTLADEEAFEVLINQARFHMAFGHKISKSFHYEIHYIHQGSNLFATNGLETSQNIFRIRLLHKL